MAVDLIARALALKAAGGGSGGSGFAKEADFNAPGFMPEENTYYIYKDSGIEPVIEYKSFIIDGEFPSGSLIHIDPDKQDELAEFIDGITDDQMGFFVGFGPTFNGGIMFQHASAGSEVTADANVLMCTDIANQNLIPIYSNADTDIEGYHVAKGFQNLDDNGNLVIDYGDGNWNIKVLNYSSDPTIFDNLDWNGKIISWAEPQAGSQYQDGVLYLYQDGAMHEIGPQGEGDDAPILNADFYAEDFKPQNGRFYRQVGTSKKVGPIASTSSPPVYYLDMDCPIEDMTYALEGLERDEVSPVSEHDGVKIWSMVNYNQSGEPSFQSLDIYHIPANTEGMVADTDFWLIGMFGGLIPIWNSAPFTLQVSPSESPVSMSAGWHDTVNGQKIIVDGVLTLGTGTFYNFNTQYWNLFASTEPLSQAAKDTIAKYHDGGYDEVALKSEVGSNIVKRYYSAGKQISANEFYQFLRWALSMSSTANEAMAAINRITMHSNNGVSLGNVMYYTIDIYNPQFASDPIHTVRGFMYSNDQVHEFLVKFDSNAITLTNLDDNTTSNIDYVSIISYYATSQYGEDF